MAYQTYITDAFVCGSKDSNTSDRSFLLFTRDAGMVYASVKIVREERSKHRYGLQHFSEVRVSLVRGKAGWKIVGTEPIRNIYNEAETREIRTLVRNMILLLRRVVHGEMAHPEIYADICSVVKLCTVYDPVVLETVFTARMLYLLGYVGELGVLEEVVAVPISHSTVDGIMATQIAALKKHITQALSASHL